MPSGRKTATAARCNGDLIFSPILTNQLLSEMTLLRPSAFPASQTLFSSVAIEFLWIALGWAVISVLAVVQMLSFFRQSASRIQRKNVRLAALIAPLGRTVGLLLMLFYLAPNAFRIVNYDAGPLLAQTIVATDFVKNSGPEGWFVVDQKITGECATVATHNGIDLSKRFVCDVKTTHCSNIAPEAMINHITDDDVAVALPLSASDPLYEFYPVKFQIVRCDTTGRYGIKVAPAGR
jgi:hypothetical protein